VRWLVDAGLPDLTRRFAPGSLDGILLTHYHADHAQGLLHLRWGVGLRIPVLAPFDPEGLADLHKHPGILDFSTVMQPLQPVQLGPLRVTPIPLAHSRPTLGYLLEHGGQRIAYLTDTSGLPRDSLSALGDAALDMLVLDCTHPPSGRPPRNHNDLNLALATVRALRPRATILTHISHDLDAWLMREPDAQAVLPDDVTIGRDGDILEFEPTA
jgi:phosphoribosyl 1,2-cyclic phosphate phosphodiesterase